MQNKIQLGEIVERSKRLEAQLRDSGAEGRGLHELITGVQDKLDPELLRKLRFIATIRNQAVHEPGFEPGEDFGHFIAACDETEPALRKIIKRNSRKNAAGNKLKDSCSVPPQFNFLLVLPFVPGLNLIYFFFLLILSLLRGSKYIIMLLLYLFAVAGFSSGMLSGNKLEMGAAAGLFAVLYLVSLFLPSRRVPGLRYIPLLNIAVVIEKLRDLIYWRLFFIAGIFIILSAISAVLIFTWREYMAGAILFALAYLGGIGFFLCAGKKKKE
ncbi:MAG: hypothetical protein PHH77_03055 [Victivallaceae bacterium]|nr:hypothetical protein [Victivallaceae bacterium]